MRRRNAQRDRDVANSLVLDWSWHDQIRVVGEVVFAPATVEVCRQKITEKIGYVPEASLAHDFGEVLNLQ